MLRQIASALVGILVAFAMVALVQRLGHAIYPPPPELAEADARAMIDAAERDGKISADTVIIELVTADTAAHDDRGRGRGIVERVVGGDLETADAVDGARRDADGEPAIEPAPADIVGHGEYVGGRREADEGKPFDQKKTEGLGFQTVGKVVTV